MKNYQALAKIERRLCKDCTDRLCYIKHSKKCEIEECLEVLEETIDAYNSMRGDYMSYEDLKAEYETQIEELKTHKEMLMKGLLLACKKGYMNIEKILREAND